MADPAALEPRSPWWMPQPRTSEGFRAFWERMGFTSTQVAGALLVQYPGAEDVANERLAQLYADTNPSLYRSQLEMWLRSQPRTRT